MTGRLVCVFFAIWIAVLLPVRISSQDDAVMIAEHMFNTYGVLSLSDLEGWKYTSSYDNAWAEPDFNDTNWESLRPRDLSFRTADKNGKIEGWFRINITLDSSLAQNHLAFRVGTRSAVSLYIDGTLFKHFGVPHPTRSKHQNFLLFAQAPDPATLHTGQVYTLGMYLVDHDSYLVNKYANLRVQLDPRISLVDHRYNQFQVANLSSDIFYLWFSPLLLLSGLFWLMYVQNREEKTILLVAIFTTSLAALCWSANIGQFRYPGVLTRAIMEFVMVVTAGISICSVPIIIDKMLSNQVARAYRFLFWFVFISTCIGYFIFGSLSWFHALLIIVIVIASVYLGITKRAYIKTLQWVMLSGMLFTLFCIVVYLLNIIYFPSLSRIRMLVNTGIYLSMPISMLIYFTIRFKNNLNTARAHAARILQLSSEKEKLIESQKSELERQVKSRTQELVKSLDDLKTTQTQLLQSEKMASLGELTAGIAHEIQNPLNFVNNFSELSRELIVEMLQEIASGRQGEATGIAQDVMDNLDKISHHGQRAAGIVKAMLLHSRGSGGTREPTDINALCDEFLRLSYHGYRAKDKSFNAQFETDFDPSLPKLNVVPQDIGRVLLNLINNAFYACSDRANSERRIANGDKQSSVSSPQSSANSQQPIANSPYTPKVTVTTRNLGDNIEIRVKDNGNGIPDHIKDKIFQPFFTTKPTGQGTGLGLSLSYEIITKGHGGELHVETREGEYSEFIISLPIANT